MIWAVQAFSTLLITLGYILSATGADVPHHGTCDSLSGDWIQMNYDWTVGSCPAKVELTGDNLTITDCTGEPTQYRVANNKIYGAYGATGSVRYSCLEMDLMEGGVNVILRKVHILCHAHYFQ